jgi:uncharacterized surface protein with fasciclin (FAS1) repeats
MIFQKKSLVVAVVALFTAIGAAGLPQGNGQQPPPSSTTQPSPSNATQPSPPNTQPSPSSTTQPSPSSTTQPSTSSTTQPSTSNTTTNGCPGTVVEIIQNDPSLTSFNRYIQQEPAALAELCNQSSNYTVFAPTDTAYSDLTTYLRTVLERPEAKTARALLIGYHIYPGNVNLTAIPAGNEVTVKTLIGRNVTIQHNDIRSNDTRNGTLNFDLGTYRINGVNVIEPVNSTSNGQVWPIDLVLDPFPDTPQN